MANATIIMAAVGGIGVCKERNSWTTVLLYVERHDDDDDKNTTHESRKVMLGHPRTIEGIAALLCLANHNIIIYSSQNMHKNKKYEFTITDGC